MAVELMLAALALLLLTAAPPAGSDAPRVLKCCALGERYDFSRGACGAAEPSPASSDEPGWPPLVYFPAVPQVLRVLPAHWRLVAGAAPACDGESRERRVLDSRSLAQFLLLDTGALYVVETHDFVPPGAFCVDEHMAAVCEDVPPDEVRFRECCPGEDFVYSERIGGCTNASSGGAGNATATAGPGVAEVVRRSWPRARITASFPVCAAAGAHFDVVGSVRGGDGALKGDGSLILRGARRAPTLTLRPRDFCLERVDGHSDADLGVQVLACPEAVRAWRPRVLAHPSGDDVRFSLYPAGLCLSVVFLAATLGAGSLLPAATHALHWRCQTAYVACLLVGDVLLAATQLSGTWGRGGLCFAVAITMHFFFLAAFFWLNTMCINIWWTFRDLRPTSMDKRQETIRLRLFRLYAWGVPFAIMLIAAILDKVPGDDSILRPRFGQKRCWFYGDQEMMYYFYIPIGILLAVNMVLFMATARELTCGLWKREVVKSTTERATLWRVCVKLVVVMGLTWILDVISWIAGGPSYIWYASDLANALQGVFIFIVVGCQPQVWLAINRMWCLRAQQDRATAAHRHLSSYSQGLPSLGDSSINSPSTKNTSPMETVC